MGIYTRTGDEGQTSLADGTRTSKADARVEACGALDEALAAVGFAAASCSDRRLLSVLDFMRQRLMNCASAVALPLVDHTEATPRVTAADLDVLERGIDDCLAIAGTMRAFTVCGGCELAARLHLARTIVRRAERRVVALAQREPVADGVLAFVNRSSDALFAAARYANESAGVAETPWDPQTPAPE